MTIQTQVDDISYSGDGSTDTFPYNFRILEETDLKVYIDDELQTLTTDYSVDGVNDDGGGDVIFVTPPADDTTVYISRSGMAYTQLTDYVENGNFPAETHEMALDKLTLLVQQLKLRVDKCIRFPEYETTTAELADVATRAGLFPKFDSLGHIDYDNLSEPTDSFIQAGTGAVTRTYLGKNRDVVHAKDFGVVGDGVTNDTTNLIKAITYCVSVQKTLSLEHCICLVSSTIDVTGATIYGGRGIDGYDTLPNIKATSAQFNVLETSGRTTLKCLTIDGGWDTVTAGQNGYGIYTDYQPYDLHFERVRVVKAKKSGIYLNHAGYANLIDVKCYACGLHGLEIYGTTINDAATTVNVGGYSVFTGMDNGFGLHLTNCINMKFTFITEATSGISLNGDNRSLAFIGCYAENITGSKFITWNSSAGIGLTVMGCYFPNGSIDYNNNWIAVHYIGNTLDTPPNGDGDIARLELVTGSELTATTSASATACSLSLPRGTWLVTGSVQTINSSGGTITRLACQFTSDNTASGKSNTTSTNYNHLAALVTGDPGSDADLRATFSGLYRQNATGNMYLRVFLNVTAGTVAYKGSIHAVKL